MQTMKSSLLGIMLSLALVLGMMTVLGAPAYADTSEPEVWSQSFQPFDNKTCPNGVKVTADITLTIHDGQTVTVSGGIDATGHTLTVAGEGTLIVTSKDGSDGVAFGDAPGVGSDGGDGIIGNLKVIDDAVVKVTAGKGGQGGQAIDESGHGGDGGLGGNGITGDLEVRNNGSAIVSGGAGGTGGNSNEAAGRGGNGGYGVSGTLTVYESGSAIMSGGSGGAGGESKLYNDDRDGSCGSAVNGKISSADSLRTLESEDNKSWYDLTGNKSEKQYVKVNPSFNVESIISNPTHADLLMGQTQQMDATIEPSYAADKTVIWSTSDDEIATVDSEGLVRTVGPGKAIITATATNGTVDPADDVTAQSIINVAPAATVLVDVGKGHEKLFTDELVNKIASEIGASKATINENTISFSHRNTFMSEGTLRNKIDNAFWKYLDNDNGEKYWSTGYKPMSEYSKYSDYSNDVYSQDHNKKISNGLKYYMLWQMPYKNLEIDNGNPACGMISWEASPSVPEGMYVDPIDSFWIDPKGEDFEFFEGGKEYTCTANIVIDREGVLWKYYFDMDALKVNVKDGEVEKTENDSDGLEGKILVTFKTSAKHIWDEGKVTQEPTCIENGIKTYSCDKCPAKRTEDIDALGHDFGKWTRLNDAQHQRVCTRDSAHVEKSRSQLGRRQSNKGSNNICRRREDLHMFRLRCDKIRKHS